MEVIRQWAFAVCAAMVACGIAQMVLPRSGMERVFQTTVSVFFLCCLLSPVVLRVPGLQIEFEQYAQEDVARRAERLTNAVAEQTNQAAGTAVRKIVRQKLIEMGINYLDITININTNGQSGQEITGVDILLEQDYQKNHGAIRSQLTEHTGLPVRIEYASRGGQEG